MFIRSAERGNVLFLILIAVALFAALSYVVSASLRGGSENAGNEKTLISSAEITQYASLVENAITRIMVSHQCAPEQISFEPPPYSGTGDYVNPTAPSDFRCHVFHKNGGQVSVQKPPPGINDGRDWAYVQRTVEEIGPDQTACGPACNDILLVLGGITEAACRKANMKITGAEDIPVQLVGGNYDNSKYTGVFVASDYIGYGAAGKRSLCIQDDFGVYFFYHVLLPR